MSKLPTLYALMERDGDSIEALDAAISRGYIEDQMEARRKVLEQHPGTEHSIAAYLPASEAIPKERIRELYERMLDDFEQKETVTLEMVRDYIGQLEALLET